MDIFHQLLYYEQISLLISKFPFLNIFILFNFHGKRKKNIAS